MGAGWSTETRDTYDDVCDYTSIIGSSATDRNGLAFGNVGDFTVTVTIDDVDETLNGPPAINSNSGQVVRVDIDVTHTSGTTMELSAYKTNY